MRGSTQREPFRVTGEQIDGSFDLDYETYLLEAKWEKSPISEGPLLVFRGKIEGKSAMTRGVFISLNGISAQAREAIVHGKQATFFIIDGYELSMVSPIKLRLQIFFGSVEGCWLRRESWSFSFNGSSCGLAITDETRKAAKTWASTVPVSALPWCQRRHLVTLRYTLLALCSSEFANLRLSRDSPHS